MSRVKRNDNESNNGHYNKPDPCKILHNSHK